MAACKVKKSSIDFRKSAAGYSHTYTDSDGLDLHIQSIFPSDMELKTEAGIAWNEALTLWEVLGYFHCPETSPEEPGGSLMTRVVAADDEADDDSDKGDSQPESDRQVLHDACLQAAERQNDISISNATDNALDECTYAAAALQLAELDYMYVLLIFIHSISI